jgi:hypothetical protein
MNPSAQSQPPKEAVYTTEGNAATSNPVETRAAQHHARGNTVEERFPTKHTYDNEAMPSSLAYGIRGAPPSEDQSRRIKGQGRQGSHSRELDGEQMRPPGEGDVADSVNRKPGAGGSQPDLASDLDRYVTLLVRNNVLVSY